MLTLCASPKTLSGCIKFAKSEAAVILKNINFEFGPSKNYEESLIHPVHNHLIMSKK